MHETKEEKSGQFPGGSVLYLGSDFKEGKKHVSRRMLRGPLSEVVHLSLAQLCGFHVHRKRFSLVPLLTICSLRPKLSLPSPIFTSRERQVFQPI